MDILTAPILIPLLAILIALIVVACMISNACRDIDEAVDDIERMNKTMTDEMRSDVYSARWKE